MKKASKIVSLRNRNIMVVFYRDHIGYPIKPTMFVDGNKLGSRKRIMYSEMMTRRVDESLKKATLALSGYVPMEEAFLTADDIEALIAKRRQK